MSTYVDEDKANYALTTGRFLGGTEPCSETKGSWWEVYAVDSKIIACVMTSDDYASCGESITDAELDLYVDDVDDARAKLAEVSKP